MSKCRAILGQLAKGCPQVDGGHLGFKSITFWLGVKYFNPYIILAPVTSLFSIFSVKENVNEDLSIMNE